MAGRRVTRGRMSNVDRLPKAILDRLNELLRGGATQRDILRLLAPEAEAAGHRLTRSGLNRYATRMAGIGQNIREAREIAEVWVAKIGERPTGEVGRLIVEMLRTFAFEYLTSSPDGSAPDMDPKMLADISLAVQRLEKAADTSIKRERALREQMAQDMLRELDSRKGLSQEAVKTFRGIVEGVADAGA